MAKCRELMADAERHLARCTAKYEERNAAARALPRRAAALRGAQTDADAAAVEVSGRGRVMEGAGGRCGF